MISDQHAETVAVAIGRRVAEYRARHRITRDALARAGSVYGVTWGRTSIENIENGRFAPTIPTLYVLCLALEQQTPGGNGRVGLLDLLPESGPVEITAGFTIELPALRKFLGDQDAVKMIGDDLDKFIRSLDGPPAPPTLTEKRAAVKLGIAVAELRSLAFELWAESLDEIVTHDVGHDASPQARGHATRHYVEELRDELEQRKADG